MHSVFYIPPLVHFREAAKIFLPRFASQLYLFRPIFMCLSCCQHLNILILLPMQLPPSDRNGNLQLNEGRFFLYRQWVEAPDAIRCLFNIL